ncbi:hypothetical protein [Lutibacter sp.]|uniref:hypothetical protein n=1 Tax=Lutibacter sp. TaxID=1925666 RepID=UPI0027359728|nr:hypothetical protein [Lutibacter sp.]MDP3314373.1 hypothetical protein [Lutibacter sp.]
MQLDKIPLNNRQVNSTNRQTFNKGFATSEKSSFFLVDYIYPSTRNYMDTY